MRKKIRYLIFTSILFISFLSFGQVNNMVYKNPNIDSLGNKKLYLEIENLNFFKDNEFSSEKISGYTLPGFKLTPKLSLVLDNNILIEGGLSLLRYWGANNYPCYSYLDIPIWEANDYQKGFHLLPYFRAQIMIKENLNFVFGNLYINNSHNLILPLYNPELFLSSDPETGVQVLFDSKYFNSDLWINWQSFIFRSDSHVEVFTFGYSTSTKINPDNKFQVYSPIQFIAQHKGGELENISPYSQQTWINYAGGIGFNYKADKIIDYMNLEFSYAGFKENAGSNSPYKKGYGIYSKLGIGVKDLQFNVSYWVGEDFMSIFGSPHFINASTSTENMVFNRIRNIYSHLEYTYKKKPNYSLGIEFDCIYYFPFTGFRTDYGKIISNDYADFSFGLYLKINPRFKLYSFKN
ncbi:MAG: hypothetical protein WCR29_05070 [Bacteroidales bacterium]